MPSIGHRVSWRRNHAAGLLIGLLVSCVAGAAWAQQEPVFPQQRPIEITVLFPAGSSADLTARLLADGMSKQLKSQVIVVNRPGAGGAVGYRHVVSQKPDGHALVWNSNSISTTFHSGQLPFDHRAFEPVARVLEESPVVAVRAESAWKSLDDLVRDARARPRSVSVANSGVGSHTHLAAVALFKAAGADVVDVPYGAAQVVPNLLGGHVDVMVQLPGALAGHLRAGTVRVLASITAQRDPALADVPTARERGLDVALDAWRGIAVPKGTPAGTVAVLERAIRLTVESPEFAQGAALLAVRPAFLPAGDFGALIVREDAQIERVMSAIGLKK